MGFVGVIDMACDWFDLELETTNAFGFVVVILVAVLVAVVVTVLAENEIK